MMKKSLFFTEISDGIIEKNFYFEVYDYIFTIHNSKLNDAYYTPPIIESGSEGECIVYYRENEKTIIADIMIPNFDWNIFQPELVSKITSQECIIERANKTSSGLSLSHLMT